MPLVKQSRVYFQTPFRLWRRRLSDKTYAERFKKKLKNMNGGPLSSEEIAAITQNETKSQISTQAQRSKDCITLQNILDAEIRKKPQTHCALTVRNILNADPTIRKIYNIGARTDVVSSFLAPLFPERSFVSVDMHDDLEGQNVGLEASPNWSVMSGYAIDLMREGRISGDLIFSTSVTCLMRTGEFEEYINLASTNFRWIMFNEVHYPYPSALQAFNYLLHRRPHSPSDVEAPYPSGKYSQYMYNYPRALEQIGFEVVFYEPAIEYSGGVLFQTVGKKRKKT